MKAPQFYAAVTLSAACLILTFVLIQYVQSNQELQAQLQSQQVEINRAATNKQVAEKIINDMVQVSVKNEKIKQVLARNGVNVNVNPSPAPAASSSTSAVSASNAAVSSSTSATTSSTSK